MLRFFYPLCSRSRTIVSRTFGAAFRRTLTDDTRAGGGKVINTLVQVVFRQALGTICILLLLPAGALLVAQEPPPSTEQAPPEQTGPPAQALPPDQLANLVAPVALYPDSLLSQVLVAATYPLEIVEAGQWLQQNRNLRGAQLVEAARQQNWDASIQALVVFPDVITRLNSLLQLAGNIWGKSGGPCRN